MRRPKDKLIAGIDLHSNNVVIGVINQDGKRVAHRKLDCDLERGGGVSQAAQAAAPIDGGGVDVQLVLAGGWSARARATRLTWPTRRKIEQYSGMKHADDKHDAFHLADLQRLNILPKAHVYDPQLRPVRDLLRRRTNLVHQRTALLLSFKSLYTRTTGQKLRLERGQEAWSPKKRPSSTSIRPTN